jgi:hypothetical protein
LASLIFGRDGREGGKEGIGLGFIILWWPAPGFRSPYRRLRRLDWALAAYSRFIFACWQFGLLF